MQLGFSHGLAGMVEEVVGIFTYQFGNVCFWHSLAVCIGIKISMIRDELLKKHDFMQFFKIAQKKPFSFEKGLYFILLRRLRFWAQFFLLSARIFLDGCAYSKVLRGGLYPFSQIRFFRDWGLKWGKYAPRPPRSTLCARQTSLRWCLFRGGTSPRPETAEYALWRLL